MILVLLYVLQDFNNYNNISNNSGTPIRKYVRFNHKTIDSTATGTYFE